MKVVLLKDVPKIGRKNDVKEVSDGYAVNFLIPKGLAEAGTVSAVKRAELKQAQELAERRIQEDLLVKNIKDLEGVTITLSAKANEKGHLFAGIHKAELIPEIKKETRLDIVPDFIVLDKPIKELGEHEVEVKVRDQSAKFKVVITESKE